MRKGEATRLRILNTARPLINKKGFKDTSIQDIIVETGVKKGNLYFHFPNKDALGLALLEEAGDQYFDYLLKSIKSADSDPIGKISDLLNAILRYHRRRQFVGGCIFGNTALEMSDTDKAYTELIRRIFNRWTDNIVGYLKQAIEAGLLSDEIDPKPMARHIIAAMEGSIMMARLYKQEAPIKESIGYIRTLLRMKDK
ncbi:MAG: TetR/AcrR family transcriptional regulator [Deltaproteobacteria bacterium]|nr:TetR/AcrR family transcriptional regulator [Deltaproteobacteria bacterium]